MEACYYVGTQIPTISNIQRHSSPPTRSQRSDVIVYKHCGDLHAHICYKQYGTCRKMATNSLVVWFITLYIRQFNLSSMISGFTVSNRRCIDAKYIIKARATHVSCASRWTQAYMFICITEMRRPPWQVIFHSGCSANVPTSYSAYKKYCRYNGNYFTIRISINGTVKIPG